MTPDLKTFLSLAASRTEQGSVIPVWKAIAADMLTPVSAYLHLVGKAKYAFLLESAEDGEHDEKSHEHAQRGPDVALEQADRREQKARRIRHRRERAGTR